MKRLTLLQKTKPFLPWLLIPVLAFVTWKFDMPLWLHSGVFFLALVGTAYAVYKNRDELEELVEKAKRNGE